MPARLWLDATVESDKSPDLRNTTSTIPPVPSLPGAPVIPPRHSTVTQGSTADSRRRSLPIKPRKSSKEKTPPVGPSPEVISNLIDSLANISFPDPIDAEQFSPPPRLSSNPLGYARSFDEDTGRGEQDALRDAINDHLNRIDDAAEPPVVRTTKPPSSYYKLNKGNKWENALGITTNGNGIYISGSNPSLVSVGSQEGGGILNLSVRKNRNSNRSSRESMKTDMSVMNAYKDSVTHRSPVRSPAMSPRLPKNSDRKRDGSGGSRSDHSGHYGKSGKTPPISAFHDTIMEDVTDAHDHAPIASKREGKKPVKSSPNPLSHSPIVSAPSVPDRRSSLLLKSQDLQRLPTEGQTSPSRSPVPNAASKIETRRQRPAEEPKTLTTFDLDGEDTEVTKRIRELKAKKQQREREARNSMGPDSDLNGLALNNEHATIPFANKRTIHEAAGSTTTRSNKPRSLNLTPRNAKTERSLINKFDDQSSDPERPTTPLTPTNLPINYSFVVQSLDASRPRSQSGSRAISDTLNRHQASNGSSLARSAITKPFLGPKRDSSLGAAPNYLRKERKSLESHSTEPILDNKRSGSLKGSRKRWSLSEVSTTIERHSSLKGVEGTTSRSLVQREIVPEEALSMQEEIGRAVEGFIHAQRLSQKIRHPITGRVISFSEVGNPKGNVVFCCVGMGLTRFITAFYDELASTLNLRLITPDRPGVGESQTDPNGTPLSWADDILLICAALSITKFSLLAHSAGAIYALATALRIPQHIRGKVHLLAPWIPPSQMEPVGLSQDPPPGTQLPKSQRFLRALPTPFLKVANSSFLSATSASLSPNLGAAGGKSKKRKPVGPSPARVSESSSPARKSSTPPRPSSLGQTRRESIMLMDQQNMPSEATLSFARERSNSNLSHSTTNSPTNRYLSVLQSPHQRSISAPIPRSPLIAPFNIATADPDLRKAYDESLTLAIWAAATTNANPAVDLLVCLERTNSIGFRYVDITRAVVIHHGSKDSRVPIDNVRWLGGMMRRTEVRVLEGESHGLMASAGVMGSVLQEMAKEWADWDRVISKGRGSN